MLPYLSDFSRLLLELVDQHRSEQNETTYDILVEGGDIHQIHCILHRTHDQYTDDRTEDRSDTTGERDTTEYTCGYDIE